MSQLDQDFFISNEPDKSPIKPPEPASRLLLAKCMLNNAHDENKKMKKPKYLDKLLLSFVSCFMIDQKSCKY